MRATDLVGDELGVLDGENEMLGELVTEGDLVRLREDVRVVVGEEDNEDVALSDCNESEISGDMDTEREIERRDSVSSADCVTVRLFFVRVRIVVDTDGCSGLNDSDELGEGVLVSSVGELS